MENFEEAVLKAKEIFDTACKKTGEVVSVQKHKLELAGLKNELEKTYAILGQMYYEKIKDEECGDNTMSLVLENIRQQLVDIETKQKQIADLSHKLTCQKCGAPIAENAVFCSSCGAKLGEE